VTGGDSTPHNRLPIDSVSLSSGPRLVVSWDQRRQCNVACSSPLCHLTSTHSGSHTQRTV